MTQLIRLSVQGIRSFGPDSEQIIEFSSPLTLIQGANGAGKTTIIECLRTIATGSLPNNSDRGRLFIHDPRIANRSEVFAVMRLKFSTPQHPSVLAFRTFQLSNRKGTKKQQFKSVEQALKIEKTEKQEKEVSINQKCANMDVAVPQFFGVSTAILDNVIFCHQDESLWPFSDQTNLQKIFDNIFDTEKYTSILNELRNQVKIKRADQKERQLRIANHLLKLSYHKKYNDERQITRKKIHQIAQKLNDI